MNSQILEDLFSMNNHVFEINLAGITSKESLQLPITGGNCINWVVGHLIVSRNDLINRFNPARRFSINHLGVYKRGSNGRNVASLVSFNELLELWEKSQQILLDLIQATSSEKFTQLAPSNKSEEAKSLLQTCLFYHFHESYHLGQLGLLRRILGKEGGIP